MELEQFVQLKFSTLVYPVVDEPLLGTQEVVLREASGR